MLNTKKMMLSAVMMSFLAAATVFAKETPQPPKALELTPQQWEMLKTMRPEQQKAAFKLGVKRYQIQEKMAALTPEQRLEVENFVKDEMEHRKNMRERCAKMTKEQKEAIHLQLPKPQHPERKHGKGPKCEKHHPQGQPMTPPPCPPPKC